MAKNGKRVELAPATTFQEVADRSGVDVGKITRFAHDGTPHRLNKRDLDNIFAAAGGEEGWQALVVARLNLAPAETTGTPASAATAATVEM